MKITKKTWQRDRWQLQQRIELRESLELAVGRIIEKKWQERNKAVQRRRHSVLQ
jgi:hypothetical protein